MGLIEQEREAEWTIDRLTKKGIEKDESLKQKDNIMSRQRNEITDLKENQAETEKLIQKLKAEAKQQIKEYEK